MINELALSLTMLISNPSLNKIEGNECLLLVSSINLIEYSRDNSFSKEKFIELLNNNKEIQNKKYFSKYIDFIYSLPIGFKYSKTIYNQCASKGYYIEYST